MSDTKVCGKCKQCKPVGDFSKCKTRADGLQLQCKHCKAAYRMARIDDSKAVSAAWKLANKERVSVVGAARYAANAEHLNANSKAYRAANIEEARSRERAYYLKNKKARHKANSVRTVDRYHSEPIFAMQLRIRALIGHSMRKRGYTKRARTHEILGCDWHTFKSHLERQFTKGMHWDNRSEWQIDHIIPLATAKTEADVIALNHFTNLRPLWAADNLAKRDTITHLI